MKSTVHIEIRTPQSQTAELFADPTNNPKWMDDVERIEVMEGQPGARGSRYRMVSKDRRMDFVATVVASDLPKMIQLQLVGSDVTISITDRFAEMSPGVTHLTSEEVFAFKGLIRRVFGVIARSQIKKAHRRHMESFKRFAEARAR
jgi:hypothetical protein